MQLLEDAFFHKKPPPAPAGVERRSSAQLLEPQTSAGPGSNYGGKLDNSRWAHICCAVIAHIKTAPFLRKA